MSRLSDLRALCMELREPGLPAGPEERAAAESLRADADDLHREADDMDDNELRADARLRAVELWAAGDSLVREED